MPETSFPQTRSAKARSLALIGTRAVAWTLAVVIAVLSVDPPRLRPETDLPHHLEHFGIFLATGTAFGFSYGRRPLVVAVALVVFAAMIEIAQLFVPGRHARLSDFFVDAAALCIGVAIALPAGAGKLSRDI